MNQGFGKGLFVVGVRKCGTTTVFDFLKNTGAFRVCRVKEPQFFCLNDEVVTSHLDWYGSLFGPGQEKTLLDGSTLYYQYPETRRRIAAHFSEARFVVCLRDPARRMFSAYWHQRAKPGGVERRSFDAILDSLEKQEARGKGQRAKGKGQGVKRGLAGLEGRLDENLAEIEQRSLEQAAAAGQIVRASPGSNYHRRHYRAPFVTTGLDPLAFFRYAAESQYSRHAEAWLKAPDTLLIFFEQLLRDPAAELRRVADFAGLSPEIPLTLPPNRNKTHDAGQALLLSRLARAGIFDALKRWMPDGAKHFFKEKFLPEAEKITPEQYARARRLLAAEYEFWFRRRPQLEMLWH